MQRARRGISFLSRVTAVNRLVCPCRFTSSSLPVPSLSYHLPLSPFQRHQRVYIICRFSASSFSDVRDPSPAAGVRHPGCSFRGFLALATSLPLFLRSRQLALPHGWNKNTLAAPKLSGPVVFNSSPSGGKISAYHGFRPVRHVHLQRFDILEQQDVLRRLHWNSFTVHASYMPPVLTLQLTSEALRGYSNRFFKTLQRFRPLCLRHFTTIKLVISSESIEFSDVLPLLTNAKVASIELLEFTKDVNLVLKLLQGCLSVAHLRLHIIPRSRRFWTALLPSWANLTRVDIDLGEVVFIDTHETIFECLCGLPSLEQLTVSSIKGTYPNSTFRFPRLTMLSLEFAFEPLSLIEKMYAPLLSTLSIATPSFWNEATFADLFRRIPCCCNPQSLTTLMVNHLDLRDGCCYYNIEEELREEAFNETTISPLYCCSNLTHLDVRPGISCHNLPDSFYANLPQYWPNLRILVLGGDLFYSAPRPAATLAGLAIVLQKCHHIEEMSFPHVKGNNMPLKETHNIATRIGTLFGNCEDFRQYLEWVVQCLPLVERVGIAKHSNSDFDDICNELREEFGHITAFECVETW
jgi:hypothetical protein